MSSLKWILIVVVILGVVAGGYWIVGGFSKKEVVSAPLDQVATTTLTAVAPKPGILTSSATDVTDDTLDADLKLIDGQISGLTSDSKAVDSGVNDKAIAQ